MVIDTGHLRKRLSDPNRVPEPFAVLDPLALARGDVDNPQRLRHLYVAERVGTKVQRQEAASQGFGTRHRKSNNSNGANKKYRFD
jgi:hypothetical protein